MTNTTYQQVLDRSPADQAFITALGAAVFQYTSMEWHAACCCEKMRHGFIDKFWDHSDKKTTANTAAEVLICETKKLPESDEKNNLLAAAEEFQRFVSKERNFLFHSAPGQLDNYVVLSKGERIYTTSELQQLAIDFFDCLLVLNKSLHGALSNL